MQLAAIWQEARVQNPFDHAGYMARLVDYQSQSVFVERTGGSVPKLAEDL